MMYLKRFNEEKEESLYKEIDQDKYQSFIEGARYPWRQSDMDKVMSAILKQNRNLWYEHNDSGHHMKIEYDKGLPYVFIAYIVKVTDDWYVIWVKSKGKFYQCDEMKGLLQFIQENWEIWNI